MSVYGFFVGLGKVAGILGGVDLGLRVVHHHIAPALPEPLRTPVQSLAGPDGLGGLIDIVVPKPRTKKPSQQGGGNAPSRGGGRPAQRPIQNAAEQSARGARKAMTRPQRDLRKKVEKQAATLEEQTAKLDQLATERDENAAKLAEMAQQLEEYKAAATDAEQQAYFSTLIERVQEAAQARPSMEEIQAGDPLFAEAFDLMGGSDDDKLRAVAMIAGQVTAGAACAEDCDGSCGKHGTGSSDDDVFDSFAGDDELGDYDDVMGSEVMAMYGAPPSFGPFDWSAETGDFDDLGEYDTLGGCSTGSCPTYR